MLWKRHSGAPLMNFYSALPQNPHAIVVIVMALSFHTEDPNRVGDIINIFLFTDLYPLAGSEAAQLTRKWGAILGGGTLTSLTDMSIMIGKQKVNPIAGWDESASQLYA